MNRNLFNFVDSAHLRLERKIKSQDSYDEGSLGVVVVLCERVRYISVGLMVVDVWIGKRESRAETLSAFCYILR